VLFWLQLKLEDFAWLKAILQAAKGNTLPFGDVGIAAIGDVFLSLPRAPTSAPRALIVNLVPETCHFRPCTGGLRTAVQAEYESIFLYRTIRGMVVEHYEGIQTFSSEPSQPAPISADW
jgi:hypothetical protein